MFGLSAWWWVALFAYLVVASYKRMAGGAGSAIGRGGMLTKEQRSKIVDGVAKQRGTTADLIFDPFTVVHYLSQCMTLEPGDVLLTGNSWMGLVTILAGLALGLSRWQLYRHVLLPQALQRLTPPTINIYTRIIKTSSLAVLIGVVEVIKVGQQIIERTYGSLLIYGLLFLFFFLVCYPLSLVSRRLEQQWDNAV